MNAFMSVFKDRESRTPKRRYLRSQSPKTGQQHEDVTRAAYSALQSVIDRVAALAAPGEGGGKCE